MLRRGYTVRNTRPHFDVLAARCCCTTALATPYINGVGPVLVLLSIPIAADNFLAAHMFAAATDLFPEHQVGRATGLTGIAGGLSGMLFPLLTGVLVDRISYTPVFACVAFMPLMGTIALFAVGRKYRTLDKPAAANA